MYVNYSFLVFKNHKAQTKINVCTSRVYIQDDLPLSKRFPQDSPLDYSNIHGSFFLF